MLWWGSSEKLSRCYLWDQLLVGGECWCYTVNSNTYAYFPLKTDMIDKWPNHLATTAVWTNTIQSWWFLRTTWFKFNNMPSQKVFTMMAWIRPETNSSVIASLFNFYEPNNNYTWWDFVLNEKVTWSWSSQTVWWYYRIEVMTWSSYNRKIKTSNSTQYTNYNKWNHFAIVMRATWCSIFINWNLSQTWTWTWDRAPYQWEMFIWCTRWWANSYYIDIWDIIYENWTNWTQQEIAKYVNCSKWNYWY